MSQRETGFNGGIKAGTTAFDAESKRLDKNLKAVSKQLSRELEGYNVSFQFNKKMKFDLVGDDCFGFAPDGGAWFKDGKLFAVFEGKKQGEGGNAYERWWDNASTAKYINKDVVYVTFCAGPGASENKCLDKLRRKAQIMLGENFKFFNNVEGFSKIEIMNIMKTILED